MRDGFVKGKMFGELLGVQYTDHFVEIMFVILSKEMAYVMIFIQQKESVMWQLLIEHAKIDDDEITVPAIAQHEAAVFRITKSKSEMVFLDSDNGKIIRTISNIKGDKFDGLAETIREKMG